MNNRIMATLFALALCLCLFIGVVPVEADATTCEHPANQRELVLAKEATCTEKGNIEYCVCTGCGQYFANATAQVPYSDKSAVEIAAKGHKAGKTTLFDDGNHWNVCTRCGEKMNVAEHVDAYKAGGVAGKNCKCDICGYEIPHDFSKCVISDASYHKTLCAACGVEKENSRVTHNFTWGTTPDECVGTCSECNYQKRETSHTFTFADNEDGTHTRTCSVCGYSDTENHVDGDDHNCKCVGCAAQMAHTYDGWQKNETVHSHYCTVCHKYVDEARHEFEYTAAPYGTETHKKICKVCGYEKAAEACVDSDGDHYCDGCEVLLKHNEKASGMITHHKTMTCEEDGIWMHYECPTCHELFRNGQVVTGQDMTNPAKGHDLVWAKAQETGHYQYCEDCEYHTDEEEHNFTYKYNNNGTHEKVCSVCGYKKPSENCSIKENCTCACGHLFVHLASDAKMVYTSYKAPTCEEDGNSSYYTCRDCGNRFVKTVSDDRSVQYTTPGDPTLQKLGHDWKNEMTVSGKHLQRCARCEISEYQEHTSSTGGCTCDIVLKNGTVCGQLVHSHEPVKVPRKAPTCIEEGYEAYWKYEACGKMFKDDFDHTPINAPIAIPMVDHEPGEWEKDGDEHVKCCEVCDEELESGEHVDANFDNRCDVCHFELSLVKVEGKAATCTESGIKEHYISRYTERSYWDEAGTQHISNMNDTLIAPLGHDDVTTDLGNGKHQTTCSRCERSLTPKAHTAGGCFCTICDANKKGHKLTEYERVEATCDKNGHLAYAKCSCGKFYNAQGVETTYRALTLKATGHKWGAEVFNDDAAGKHYAVCEICRAKNYGEHEVTASDPLSGNYHQFVCECGEVSLEAHYDKNGDNVCDEAGCKRDLSNKEVTVNNNPSTTVVTGDKNTVNTGWSWLRNWLNNAVGSNAGGSTTPTQTAQPGTATGSQGSTSGNRGTTTTPATGSNTGNTGNTGSTGSTGSTGAGSNAGSSTQGGSQTAEATGVLQAIISFFNWILSGFGG